MKRKSVFLFFVSILLSGCLDVTPSYIESRGENPVITDVSDCSIEKPQEPQEATSPKIKNSVLTYIFKIFASGISSNQNFIFR